MSKSARRRRALGILLALVPLGVFATPAPGRAGEEEPLSGEEVARRVNARDDGRFLSREVTMTLVSRGGSERRREARFLRREEADGLRRVAVFFTAPANIRGTAFLTWDHPDPSRDDESWLYLPALRRSRRIAVADRGHSFVGTDLTYEEVKKETRLSLADYRWKRLADGEADGAPCHLVEAVPVDDETSRELGYSRVEYCVDPEPWLVRRADYWDLAGRPLKSVRVDRVRTVQGIATPHRVQATNHQTGHRTVFEFRGADYRTPLPERLFTERQLRQGLP